MSWNRLAQVPVEQPFAEAVTGEEFARLVQRAAASAHPSFRLAPEVFIEIPPPSWGHGDFLVYLPARCLMVRRNYADYWYIDMGIFKPLQGDLYGWTDLWLDVIAPEPPIKYTLLDAGELAEALRRNEVSIENAALALDTLNSILTLLRGNERSLRELLPEVNMAEQFYEQYRAAEQGNES